VHPSMTCLAVLLGLGLLGLGSGPAAGGDKAGAYTLVPDEHGMVLKTPDGRTVFRYMTRKPARTKLTANSVCCLHPVKTPGGEEVVEFAPSDHPHHRGVFLAWHAIQGPKSADFWGWGQFAPTKDRVIVNRGLKLLEADNKHAAIEAKNQWTAEGHVMIDETTTIAARQQQGCYVIDFDFRLTPIADLTLQQTAFGGFCVKSFKTDHSLYTNPQGEVKLPAPHHLKPETDWPAAHWYDYTFQLASGKRAGAAIIDHPGNPSTAWHNLQPIAMLNSCIVAPGPVALKAGRPLRLRYRLVVHDGPALLELLGELAKQWREE